MEPFALVLGRNSGQPPWRRAGSWMRETLTQQLRRQRLEAAAKSFDTTLPQPVLSRVPTAQAPKASGFVSPLPKESTAIQVEPHCASGTARSEDHQSSDSVPVFVARDRRLGSEKNEVPDLQCEARLEKLSSKDEIRDATLDFVRAMQQRYSAVEVAQRRAASDAREAEGFEAALTFDLILEGPTKDPAPPPAYSKGPAQKGASRPFVPGQRGLHVSHGTTLQREPAAGAVHASGAGSGRLVPAEGGRMRRASQWAGNRRPLPQAGCE